MRASRALTVLGLLLLGSLLGGTAFGAATQVFTSKNIKDGTIQNRDIRKGVISLNRLTTGAQNRINQGGAQGPAGAPGAPGAPGTPGAPGAPGAPGGSTPTLTSGEFGVVNRNTRGSPVAQLRTGPVAGDSHPPLGNGSLGMLVAGGEKLAYGLGETGRVENLDEVGFSVYTTGENNARGNPNMPNIQFEINPHLESTATTFSTLTFVPHNTASYRWTTIDATDPAAGFWWLTGAAGTATGCTQAATCSFAQVKEKLDDGGEPAQIGTLMVNKGTDSVDFQGAVDALRVNGRVADFEEGGVVIKNAQ